jgi:hypothetical protein
MSALQPNMAVRTIYPPLLLALLTAGFVVWSYSYSPTSRMVPLVVGYVTLALLALDLVSRLNNRAGEVVRIAAGADFSNLEMDRTPESSRELRAAVWMAAAVLAVLVLGHLVAVPLLVIVWMRLNGGRSWREALTAAAATGLFIYIVFELLLSYELYRGVFLDKRGLAGI